MSTEPEGDKAGEPAVGDCESSVVGDGESAGESSVGDGDGESAGEDEP